MTIGGWVGLERAQLGDRHARLREQLEQERLELLVGAVDLVDEQHGGARARVLERGEQRPLHQVVGPEQRRLGEVLAARLREPDAEQLPRVVPLVERLGGVDALEALQPDQRGVEQVGERLGGLRLADAGLALEQQRLRQAYGAEQRRGERGVGEVAHVGETAHERRGVGDQVVEAHVVAYFAGSATYARRHARAAEPHALAIDVGEQRVVGHRDGHAAHRVDRGLGLEADDSEAGHRRLGDGRVRAGVRGARHARALAHHLREHAQRDLLRGARTDVEACGVVDAGLLLVVELEGGHDRVAALRARDETDVRHAHADGGDERLLLALAVRGDHDGVGGGRGRRRRTSRPRSRGPGATSVIAAAIGLSPSTATRGSGRTGSRKISSVPPDRHTLCTTVLPGCVVLRLGRDAQQHRVARARAGRAPAAARSTPRTCRRRSPR